MNNSSFYILHFWDQSTNAPLFRYTEPMVNITSNKSKFIIETLKLTAAWFKSFSLSSNQIGFNFRFFVLYNNLESNIWCLPFDSTWILDSKDYKAYINPRLLAVTDINEYGFE